MPKKSAVTATGTIGGCGGNTHLDINDGKRTGSVKVGQNKIRLLEETTTLESYEFRDRTLRKP